MGSLIAVAFTYSFASGFIVTALVLLSMSPLFFSNFVVIDSFYNNSVSYFDFVFELITLNTVQSQFFTSAWIFIYVSVTSNRKIKDADVANLRLENKLKEAKFANLSHQLNPHLLFNTLNNIRFMIYEDQHKADEMITSLSEILRYSLKESVKEKVTLEKELEIVYLYIAIIKMQFGDHMEIDISLDDNLAACLVPPMSLQLLVENAIKHGLEKNKNGRLVVRIQDSNQKITIFVENPISPIKNMESKGAGVGQKNIRERLNILYGNAATLQTEIIDDRYQAILSIPKEIDTYW